MNEIERRTLLSAAGIGAIAALSKAGPLDPPEGPVAPTGRTLDEVYNRIPSGATLGAYDGRFPLQTRSITGAGSYVLVQQGLSSIYIGGDNVTLDLNGLTVYANPSPSLGMCLYVAGSGVVVRNGTLQGGLQGLVVFGSHVVFEDMLIRDSVYSGIECQSSRGVIFRRCALHRVGYGRTTNALATGIRMTDVSECTVEDCSVHMSVLAPTTPALTVGIYTLGTGVLVARNCVSHASAINGQAFSLNGSGVYRENTTMNYTNQYATAGTWVNGPGNV